MSSRAEDYKQRAAECEHAATHGKAVYLELAHQWRELARQAEMLDRGSGDGNDIAV
jgi:hypothetical protein